MPTAVATEVCCEVVPWLFGVSMASRMIPTDGAKLLMHNQSRGGEESHGSRVKCAAGQETHGTFDGDEARIRR